jgi:hypothetical protein
VEIIEAEDRGPPAAAEEAVEQEVEDEEVLVEDFDGECCRTYPYNHSRILRY